MSEIFVIIIVVFLMILLVDLWIDSDRAEWLPGGRYFEAHMKSVKTHDQSDTTSVTKKDEKSA